MSNLRNRQRSFIRVTHSKNVLFRVNKPVPEIEPGTTLIFTRVVFIVLNGFKV